MYHFDSEKEGKFIILSDGRKLGYAIFGNQSIDSYPIIYFHGFPGSRLEGKFFDEGMQKSNFKLIAVDRPGIGLSDPKSNRTLLDWPKDIIELLDQLGIEKCGILGISGGAPYVCACASQIPTERLVACATISGLGPFASNKKYMAWYIQLAFNLFKKYPKTMKKLMNQFMRKRYYPEKRAIKNTLKDIRSLKKRDQVMFDDPKLIEYFIADNYWGFNQGVEGEAQDLIIFANDWGFNLTDIPAKVPFFIFHGEADDVVPVETGKYFNSQITHSIATFYPNEGHFSTAYNHFHDVAIPFIKEFEKVEESQ